MKRVWRNYKHIRAAAKEYENTYHREAYYLYCIQDGNYQATKIGHTNCPEIRLGQLQKPCIGNLIIRYVLVDSYFTVSWLDDIAYCTLPHISWEIGRYRGYESFEWYHIYPDVAIQALNTRLGYPLPWIEFGYSTATRAQQRADEERAKSERMALAKERQALGDSWAEIARELNVQQATVKNWVLGQ